jgi:hypothetical protein
VCKPTYGPAQTKFAQVARRRYVHDGENSVVLARSHVVWKVSKVLSKRRWEW